MKKGAIESDTLIKWVIALILLALLVMMIFNQREKIFAYLSKLFEVMRFK